MAAIIYAAALVVVFFAGLLLGGHAFNESWRKAGKNSTQVVTQGEVYSVVYLHPAKGNNDGP